MGDEEFAIYDSYYNDFTAESQGFYVPSHEIYEDQGGNEEGEEGEEGEAGETGWYIEQPTLDYTASYADYERAGGFGEKTPEGFGSAGIYGLTEEEILKSKFYKVFNSEHFAEDQEGTEFRDFKKFVMTHVESLPGVSHMNVLTLVLAARYLWVYSSKGVDQKSTKTFLSPHNKVNPIDFVRYVRFLQEFLRGKI